MQIIGHRGAPSAASPENTLASVSAALAAGADGVEVDVRLTADDVPVCLHDAGLSRVAGVRRGLRSLASTELTGVRVQGHVIPTVAEVVARVPAGRTLVLDLKPEQRPRRLVVQTLAALSPARADVVLSSSDPSLLDACARLAPDVPRAAILSDSSRTSSWIAASVRRGDTALHVPLRVVFAMPELVQSARSYGLQVRAWTVNRVVDARLLSVLAVDGVITDVPGELRAGLRLRSPLQPAE
jgi:glycerophosphoryl diester phosphodiesterase